MKKHPFIKNVCVSLSLISVLLIAGCSDEKTASKNSVEKTPISHTLLGTSTTASDKQKFEQAFENQCVQRELKNSAIKSA